MNRQEEIMKAAAKVFKAKGYHAATIQDIADEVGLLKGSLYYHIDSKEQLLVDILLSALNLMHDNLRQVLATECSYKEKIYKAIMAHMRALEVKYDEVSVFLSEIDKIPSPHREEIVTQVRSYDTLWIQLIQDGQNSGDFRTDLDPKIVYYSIMGMCNWTPRWFKMEGRYTPTQVSEIYAAVFLNGFLK